MFSNEYGDGSIMEKRVDMPNRILTGIGYMDIKDYLNLRACDAGYGTYAVAWEAGWRCFGYENVQP